MNSRKSRKPLDDALAKQFIYGDKQPEIETEPAPEQKASEPVSEPPSPTNSSRSVEKAATEKKSNESPLVGKFQTSPREATIRFTVDLPASMHRKLSILAARTGKKKAEIVRVLLEDVLKDVGDR